MTMVEVSASASAKQSIFDPSSDEISALVLDPGYNTTRAGFAGEDVPKAVVPSQYGRTERTKYIFGDNSIHTPLPGMEMHNPMAKDGTVEDWDAAKELWEYAITSRLTNPRAKNPLSNGLNDSKDISAEDQAAMDIDSSDPQDQLLSENPLLMTETSWASGASREKAIEVAMEEWGVPAFWLARSGVLAAFAAGKPSALVIDVGASGTSVTPVHDGLILRKGVTKSPLGANFISDQLRLIFSTSQPQIPLTPHYMVTSKTQVDAQSQAQATYRTFPSGFAPTPSFRTFQEERLLTEFKESVVQVWPGPGRLSGSTSGGVSNEDLVKAQPGRPFEFPDGYNQLFSAERYRAAEGLFDAKAALMGDGVPAVQVNQTIPALVQQALNAVDVDVRTHLLANTVITGGGSLTQGLVDRVNQELMAIYPGPRVKTQAPGNLYERRFGAWIGGSILASLGTFHQVSTVEYILSRLG